VRKALRIREFPVVRSRHPWDNRRRSAHALGPVRFLRGATGAVRPSRPQRGPPGAVERTARSHHEHLMSANYRQEIASRPGTFSDQLVSWRDCFAHGSLRWWPTGCAWVIARAISNSDNCAQEASPSLRPLRLLRKLFRAQFQPWTGAASIFHSSTNRWQAEPNYRCSGPAIRLHCCSMATPNPGRGWIQIHDGFAEAIDPGRSRPCGPKKNRTIHYDPTLG